MKTEIFENLVKSAQWSEHQIENLIEIEWLKCPLWIPKHIYAKYHSEEIQIAKRRGLTYERIPERIYYPASFEEMKLIANE